MLACTDVDYRTDEAVAACVLFHAWDDAAPGGERVAHIASVEPYQPGQFYRRELPCLLAVLGEVVESLEAVIVDGHVWLDDRHRPGLGAHLHQALGGRCPVIGVAKSRFAGLEALARPVYRGGSRRPLYVTAVGMDPVEAAGHVRGMHGAFRIPTLLKQVDQLCRGG